MKRTIFSDRSVQLIVLLNDYIPVSRALSEEQVTPSIVSAWELFIVPLMGDEFSNSLLNLTDKENPSDVEAEALNRLRRAVANLAFWHNFDELNVHITDQGFQRQESDSFKPLFRYQELELKQRFKNKGFNAIDRVMALLIPHVNDFPGFEKAPAYIDNRRALVKGAGEIQRYASINNSHLVYLMMLPLFRKIMDCVIEGAIGAKATEVLDTYLQGGFDPDDAKAVLAEKLRVKVAAVVILRALAMHVRTVGSITDRGLYYSSIEAASSEIQAEEPASKADRARLAMELEKEADSYMHRLSHFVREEMNEVYAGDPHDVLNRDNHCKKTFWA